MRVLELVNKKNVCGFHCTLAATPKPTFVSDETDEFRRCVFGGVLAIEGYESTASGGTLVTGLTESKRDGSGMHFNGLPQSERDRFALKRVSGEIDAKSYRK